MRVHNSERNIAQSLPLFFVHFFSFMAYFTFKVQTKFDSSWKKHAPKWSREWKNCKTIVNPLKILKTRNQKETVFVCLNRVFHAWPSIFFPTYLKPPVVEMFHTNENARGREGEPKIKTRLLVLFQCFSFKRKFCC